VDTDCLSNERPFRNLTGMITGCAHPVPSDAGKAYNAIAPERDRMSRKDVLVDPDWVQARIDDPEVVVVEVDEGHVRAYDRNRHQEPPSASASGRRTSGPGPPGLRRSGRLPRRLLSEKEASATTTPSSSTGRATTTGFASYAYWYCSSSTATMDVPAPRRRRKKWELDSRDLVDGPRSRPAPPRTYEAVRPPRTPIDRAFRDDAVAAIGR